MGARRKRTSKSFESAIGRTSWGRWMVRNEGDVTVGSVSWKGRMSSLGGRASEGESRRAFRASLLGMTRRGSRYCWSWTR
jgi:hypothetical protein